MLVDVMAIKFVDPIVFTSYRHKVGTNSFHCLYFFSLYRKYCVLVVRRDLLSEFSSVFSVPESGFLPVAPVHCSSEWCY